MFRAAAAVGLASGVGFAVAVLLVGGPGFGLHESAGAVLLGLLAIAIVEALRVRSVRPELLGRSLIALGFLLGMGASGALLGLVALPASLDGLPIVFLAGLVAAQAEMIRISAATPGELAGTGSTSRAD